MNKSKQYTLQQLADHVGGRIVGEANIAITGLNSLAEAAPGEISFFTDGRYKEQLQHTKAGAVILREEFVSEVQTNALVVDKPYLSYARVAELFAPEQQHYPGIHPLAVVADDAVIGAGVSIGPHCVVESGAHIGAASVLGAGSYIGSNSSIGSNCHLYPRVTVYYGVTIGDEVTIHSGTVIGSDGFGFAHDQGEWHKIPQIGGVVIGNKVEIGANTTIDRGALEDTIIGNGVILDNQIQVAHNVKIGDHTAIAGCVGIAGSAKIGRNCGIGGGAGILGHLEITDGVQVTAMSLVTKSISQPGVYSSGTSIEPTQQWHKNYARFRHLDDMAKRLKQLEKIVQEQNKE